MNNQHTVIGLMVVLPTLLLVISGAQAADVSVGGGLGFKPDYEGSSDYEAVSVPFENRVRSLNLANKACQKNI